MKEKYTQKNSNEKIKKLRTLDKRVDFIATMISILTGILGTCFSAAGIISIIKDFHSLPAGIALSVTGFLLITVVPFMHTKIHNSIKSLFSPKILSLIEEIEKNGI